jgi:hypothetical protein
MPPSYAKPVEEAKPMSRLDPRKQSWNWRPDQGTMEIPVRTRLQNRGIQVRSDIPIQLPLKNPDTGEYAVTIPDGLIAKSPLAQFWHPYYLHGEAHRGKQLDKDNLILEQLKVLGYAKPLIITHGAYSDLKADLAASLIIKHLDDLLTPTRIDLETINLELR